MKREEDWEYTIEYELDRIELPRIKLSRGNDPSSPSESENSSDESNSVKHPSIISFQNSKQNFRCFQNQEPNGMEWN